MILKSLVLRYALFAILATFANLATQRYVLWFDDSGTLFVLAVAAGTTVSLLLKYVLDKRWVFSDISVSVKSHSKRFSLYTLTGIVTTVIFWGIETLFWFIWETHSMRELGAVLGLSIGYIFKYKLDRRFVFTDTKLAQMT
ncbi:GtrA family protein [Amylibacter sp.]|nr:GtrA family protein [Amylibacter sp.]